jgi:hypothetical protein
MPFARRGFRSILAFVCLAAVGRSAVAQSGAAAASPIKDNSFLIEEAYNQEAGVVQHISTFTRPSSGGGWAFSFTQEWPVKGMKHQFSYTIPFINAASTGVGDLAINYRYQLVGLEGGKIAFAPRLSAIAPSGDEKKAMGTGAFGVQANLPVSVELSPAFTMHANAGATLTPSAKDAIGNQATTTSFAAGGSLIWLTTSTFNVMLESVWTSNETVAGADLTERNDSFVIAPGVRKAFNTASGMQIVPGVAFVKGLGNNSAQKDWFFYFSIEHSFKR